ncbi:hypothetical protein ACS0TY_035061 [Phlomoides rotata]
MGEVVHKEKCAEIVERSLCGGFSNHTKGLKKNIDYGGQAFGIDMRDFLRTFQKKSRDAKRTWVSCKKHLKL